MMKKYYIFIILTLIVILSNAQDIHFAQYNNTPLLINPSNAGEAGGDRFIINYRNQWRSITKNSYKTYSFSYDTYFKKDKFAFGFMAYKDKAGDGNFSTSQFNATLATKVNFNEKNYLKLGLQAGLTQKSLGLTQLTWNNQIQDGVINENIASGENSSIENEAFFDMSSGILFTSQMTEGSKLNIGFSAYHVNRPKYHFISDNTNINIRWNTHINIEINKADNSNMVYYPSILYMQQGNHSEVNFGGIIKYNLGMNSIYTGKNKSSSLYFGAFYRVNDALIAYTRLNYRKQFDIAITYDINLSYLHHSTHAKGGMELSMIYIIPEKNTFRK